MQFRASRKQKLLFPLLAALMLLPLAFCGCQAQPASDVYTEKLASFLGDVLGLDMTHCTLTRSQGATTSGAEMTFTLNYDHHFYLNSSSAYIIVSFYDGSIATCNIFASFSDLHYKQPSLDRYNATLGFLQRYQTWTGDASVAKMVALLHNAGFENSTVEVSDDLELKISVNDSEVKYAFYDFYGGVEYTGLTLTYVQNGDILFRDSRVNQQIGDTTINITEEQAVNIAKEYVQNLTYTTNALGRNISQTGFNVSGVYAVYLESAPIGSSVRLPYWHVWLNVSDPILSNQQGFELYLTAKDGTVAQIKPFQLPYRYTPPITDYQSPMMLLVAALIFPLIGGLVAVLIVLVVVLKVTSPKPAAAPQKEQRKSVQS